MSELAILEAPDSEMGAVPMHAVVPRLYARIGYTRERLQALGDEGVI